MDWVGRERPPVHQEGRECALTDWVKRERPFVHGEGGERPLVHPEGGKRTGGGGKWAPGR
jgi:hypothetical protein